METKNEDTVTGNDFHEENVHEVRYMGRTNVPDYGVPSGVQLTENLIEEIVEAAKTETPERPVER